MKIAIPLAEGKLTTHFGHCASFAMIDVDTETKKILKREDIAAPEHQPGLLPPSGRSQARSTRWKPTACGSS